MNMSRRVTSLLPPKTLDHNLIFFKLVLRDKKKRSEASTSRAQSAENMIDADMNEDAFWDNS